MDEPTFEPSPDSGLVDDRALAVFINGLGLVGVKRELKAGELAGVRFLRLTRMEIGLLGVVGVGVVGFLAFDAAEDDVEGAGEEIPR